MNPFALFATPPHAPAATLPGPKAGLRRLAAVQALQATRRHKVAAVVWGAVVVASAAVFSPAAQAFTRDAQREAPTSTLSPRAKQVLPLSELPSPGQEVYRRILSGGPFRYDKDGTVFANREARLPRNPRGFYHEYTVPTPGLSHRGARRIVCGGEIVQRPETCYFTRDHYQSFQKIDPSR